jgi:putative nucleotidyltransferase with HDIG domain
LTDVTSGQLTRAPSTATAAPRTAASVRKDAFNAGRTELESHVTEPSTSAEWAAAGLEEALRIRAPGAQACTPIVRQLAGRAGRELGLDASSLALLDNAARVRDVGMIGLPDSVVLATGPLSPDEWRLMNRHPVIGAEMLETIRPLASSAGLVRAHHERWDGDGYPDGRRGEDIPMLSRIIATCDAFAATASDRPHRRGLGSEAALALICRESGTQFDPATVEALVAVLARARNPNQEPRISTPSAGRRAPHQRPHDNGRLDFESAIAAFDVVPALAPAAERALEAARSDTTATGELVRAVESDMGLTVAVMRRAQPKRGVRPITNVADAVVALGPGGVADIAATVPRAAFPWRTSKLEALMHRSLVHAQAVARATERIARELQISEHDDLLLAALLHDVGKLVISRARPEYNGGTDRTETPEARARHERQAWSVDHASLGGLLIQRWGLPSRLADTIAAHHRAEDANEIATHIRLADMATHHAQGDAIDRRTLLSLANTCGVSAAALREILFDLPHSDGSHQRRGEPSPLSPRETDVIRGLAEGKTYEAIAHSQGRSASTVRTHIHHAYGKLGVVDRAQAVLRATEMGWIDHPRLTAITRDRPVTRTG